MDGEFIDTVPPREHCQDDAGIRSGHGSYRAVFADGREAGRGCEAPEDGLRKAMREAQQRL